MQLQEALTQITEIRAQIARTEVFRGYRSLTIGFSGMLGILAAMYQAYALPRPEQQVDEYLKLWVGVAATSLIVVGVEMTWRCYLAVSPRAIRLTLLAVEQFLPCLFAGGLLTAVLPGVSKESIWMMPGLWAVLFSLGVFASCRLLPKPTFWVGVFYLVAGIGCLSLGRAGFAYSPWLMGGIFGGGQLLTAGILYWTLERQHG